MSSGDKSLIEPTPVDGIEGDVAPAPARSRRSASGDATHSKNRDTGAALKTVYQQTVDEAVPQDLLDLLGKLS